MFISSIFAVSPFLILAFEVVEENRLFKRKIQPMFIFNRKVRYRIIENFQHSWKLCLTVGYSACEDCGSERGSSSAKFCMLTLTVY